MGMDFKCVRSWWKEHKTDQAEFIGMGLLNGGSRFSI